MAERCLTFRVKEASYTKIPDYFFIDTETPPTNDSGTALYGCAVCKNSSEATLIETAQGVGKILLVDAYTPLALPMLLSTNIYLRFFQKMFIYNSSHSITMASCIPCYSCPLQLKVSLAHSQAITDTITDFMLNV